LLDEQPTQRLTGLGLLRDRSVELIDVQQTFGDQEIAQGVRIVRQGGLLRVVPDGGAIGSPSAPL
jgi:hypothetical protein